MSESVCFRTSWHSQRVYVPQAQIKFARQSLYPIVLLSRDRLSSKASLLVRSEILGLFVETLTQNDKGQFAATNSLGII